MRNILFLVVPFATAANLIPHRIKATALRSLNTITRKGLKSWPNTYESVLPAAMVLNQVQPESDVFCQASEERCGEVWKSLPHVRAELVASKLCNDTVTRCWSNEERVLRDLLKTKVPIEHFSGIMILKSMDRLSALDAREWMEFYESWSTKIEPSSDVQSYIDAMYMRGCQLIFARTVEERRKILEQLREMLYHPRGTLMYIKNGDVFSKSEYLLAVGEILSLMEEMEPGNLLDKGAKLSLGSHIVDVLSNSKLIKDNVFDVLSNLLCALDKLSSPQEPLISVVVTGSADDTVITLSSPFREALTQLPNLTLTAPPGSPWRIRLDDSQPEGNVYFATTDDAEARLNPSSLTVSVVNPGYPKLNSDFNPIEYHRTYAELFRGSSAPCKLKTYLFSSNHWRQVSTLVTELQPQDHVFVQTSCMMIDASSDIEVRNVQGHTRMSMKPLLTPMGLTLVGFPADHVDLNKFGNHPMQISIGNMTSPVLQRSFPVEQKYDNEVSTIGQRSNGIFFTSRDLDYSFPREIPSGNLLGAMIFSLLVVLFSPFFVYRRMLKTIGADAVVVDGWKSGVVKMMWGGLVLSGWLSLIYYWALWKLLPYGRFLAVFVSAGLVIGMAMISA